MCGIAGILKEGGGAVVAEREVKAMCDTIVHRGPDDEGFYVKGGVGLGMRRLSIIDLSGGHQPVHNEDKTIWIVFNGEIYNFPELRPELEKRGHRFYTHTDTEVIVHLYEDMGADCVQKLRGMFAFAIYDERRQSLLLARDRLGKKPLHYSYQSGRLLFGSEIKTIFALAPELKEIDYAGLLQYFNFGYVPEPRTAFRAIQKLPPGHTLELSRGHINIKSYWDVPAYGTREPRSEEECLEEMEQRLAEAVRIRLISDVPLGALLSGGTDSSIVVALMARASSKPVKTFSIGFRSQDFNEADYARCVAKTFATDHHELVLEPNIGETLDKLTRIMEEPFSDSSMLPTYFVSCLARQHVTVALAGDAGDELFAGYDRYAVDARRRRFDAIPAWAGRFYREIVHPRLPSGAPGRRFAYNVSLPWQERYLDAISAFRILDREGDFLTDDFRATLSECPDPFDLFRGYLEKAPARDRLSKLLYLDTKTYLTSDILCKVDRMSMATSLEVRVPILDHVFLEWVTALPAHWKYRNGEQKYIFKKLAGRLGVPKEVLYRPKQGFALPLVHWMRREFKEDLARLLLEPRTIQRGYFKARPIEKLLDEHFTGRREHTGRIWRLLIFELWHRNFLEVPSPGESLPLTFNSAAVEPHLAPRTEGARPNACPAPGGTP